MIEYYVEVYVPTLVARRAHFPAFPPNDPTGFAGLLYLPGEDLEAEMRHRGMIPRTACVLTRQIQLGVSEPDGRTKVGRGWRDILHGRRLKFALLSDHHPQRHEFRPWELKKVEEVPLDETAEV